MARKMKVAIVGHSFVRRLEEFSRDINEKVHPEHDISFHGKGGAKVAHINEMVNDIPKDTKLVFIQSGGNDINPQTSATNIAHKMLKVAERINQEVGVPVIIGTVFIRTQSWHQTVEEYDQKRLKINQEFQALIRNKNKIVAGCHEKFFRRLRCSYLLGDGVHLNPVGQKAFMLFIRKQINMALRKFYNLQGPQLKIRPGQVRLEKKDLMKLKGSYTYISPAKRRRSSY